jgi:hypothetical protein
MKCDHSGCRDPAEVRVSWPIHGPEGELVPHGPFPLCGFHASAIWNEISTRYSATEACMSFNIEPLD